MENWDIEAVRHDADLTVERHTRKTSDVSDDVLDGVLRSMRRTIKNYTPYFPPSILKKIRKWERMLSSMKE